jgi:CheY-like chemotaxis protein
LESALAKPDVVDPEKKLDLDKIDWADRKLLVVEDEESNFQLVKELLRKTKIQVSWAMDGEEGLRLFNKEKDWDIILMDIKLPGLDGYEVTQQIRASGSKVPIIAQTAYAMVGDREKSIEAGCNNYITKPIRREMLIEMMEVFLARNG